MHRWNVEHSRLKIGQISGIIIMPNFEKKYSIHNTFLPTREGVTRTFAIGTNEVNALTKSMYKRQDAPYIVHLNFKQQGFYEN